MITTTAILKHKYDSPSGNVSYVLFQPEHTFSFTEWQFCMIEIEIDRKTIKKPYSIATTNLLLQEEKCIWFVVKKASENGMSDFLTQSIKVGDQVTLKWALGHYIDPKIHQNYLFVSIGSGLSPNFWIFQHLVYESRAYHHIINIVGERSSQELVPYIQDRFMLHGKDTITNFFCLSQKDLDGEQYVAWYVQTKLAAAIDILWLETTCFVCGSPAVVTDVVYQLTALGIAREHIVVEKY
jgi:ferredoxin-NADP reductase